MHLGLGVEERNCIDATESKQVQDRWKNDLLKDVSKYMAIIKTNAAEIAQDQTRSTKETVIANLRIKFAD